jgi:hypothetical protein
MKPKAYILTRAHNDYDQHGEYFVAWFYTKPTAEEIRAAILRQDKTDTISDEEAAHILAVGGRRNHENVWWILTKESSSNTRSSATPEKMP